MSKPLVALAALALIAFGAQAQTAASTATPRIDKRQQLQQQRIQRGQASGQLNAAESQRLEKQEQHIANMETQAKSDGTVTSEERRRIRHAEDRTGRRIRRQAHDPQTAASK
jgi:uncharacterized membrane protein YebE (DUF533 family)